MSEQPLGTGVDPHGTLSACARPLAEAYDVALLDLDGVVYVGALAVAHAADSLQVARTRYGMRSAYVTNNAARPPDVVAAHLVDLGIQAEAGEVVTSAQAGARMVAERVQPGSHVLAIGGPGVAEALRERGLVPVESFDDDPLAVMQGYGQDVGWRQLAEATLAIDRGRVWVATNLDRTIPSPRGRVLGNGSMVAALQCATGAVPLVAGKPEPPLMRESVARASAQRPLVVGDRLDTDIEGAARVGIPSLLVLTGVTDWPELLTAPPEQRPTYLDWDLRGLLRAQPGVSVDREVGALVARCGAVTVRVPVGLAVDGSELSSGRETRTPSPPTWWLPPEALAMVDHAPRMQGADSHDADSHDADSGAADSGDLDLARALVAAAWAAADADLRIEAPAEVLTRA